MQAGDGLKGLSLLGGEVYTTHGQAQFDAGTINLRSTEELSTEDVRATLHVVISLAKTV